MRVAVVGAGLWGQALARLVEGSGNEVLLGVLGRKPRRKIPNTKDLADDTRRQAYLDHAQTLEQEALAAEARVLKLVAGKL